MEREGAGVVSGTSSWANGGGWRGSRRRRRTGVISFDHAELEGGSLGPLGISSVSSWGDGADTQTPGLRVPSSSYKILYDLGIYCQPHSRPGMHFSPNNVC